MVGRAWARSPSAPAPQEHALCRLAGSESGPTSGGNHKYEQLAFDFRLIFDMVSDDNEFQAFELQIPARMHRHCDQWGLDACGGGRRKAARQFD